MHIVPSDESFVVEARLSTNDIEQVYLGQQSRIRPSAFDARTTALTDGEVVSISADRHQDADGYYYQVELKVSESALSTNPSYIWRPVCP
ncbi:MAG: epimerase transport system membrane fusion protein [Candidatus Azotimanducaceae bacterium]|jgi:epimerase transport system membrane fusion protein